VLGFRPAQYSPDGLSVAAALGVSLALAAGYDSQTVEGAPISFGFGLMLQPRSTKRTKAHEIRRTQQPQ
jgi:hypothetical protein